MTHNYVAECQHYHAEQEKPDKEYATYDSICKIFQKMKLIFSKQKHHWLFGDEEAGMGKKVRLQKGQEESSGADGQVHHLDLWNCFWDVGLRLNLSFFF